MNQGDFVPLPDELSNDERPYEPGASDDKDLYMTLIVGGQEYSSLHTRSKLLGYKTTVGARKWAQFKLDFFEPLAVNIDLFDDAIQFLQKVAKLLAVEQVD